METMIPVEQGDVLGAVRSFLRKLMESGIVEAILVPLEAGDGVIVPALVTDPAQLARANPLAPVMPINNARALASLTGKAAPARLGAWLRPCEVHALVELVKLQQATLDGLILISMDCSGTYEVTHYHKNWLQEDGSMRAYLAAAKDGQDPSLENLQLRIACQVCSQPAAENTAIFLHLFGCDTEAGIPVTLSDSIAQSLGMTSAEESPKDWIEASKAAREKLASAHGQKREKELQAIRTAMASNGGLAGLYATCINCHNCKTACPICYCKTCLFETESLRHEPMYYFKAAQRKGALRLLPDTMLFHLTRMNHMSLSCVSCGMCSSACPMEIPVASIFMAVGSQVQKEFGYQPGRDAAEVIPLITFQPNEWVEVGEEK